MPPHFVGSAECMDRFLSSLEGHDRLAVDTESNPFHAYRDRLCLIQVSTDRDDFIVDPLADLDLEPFLEILEDRDVTKVLHDAEGDLIQLQRTYDLDLRSLFDTKVAAVALGEPAVGLAALVERCCGVPLDKAQQRSDWAKRPLTERQVRYASRDTHYLLALADLFEERMAEREDIVRLEFDSECRRLERLEVKPFQRDPDAWMRVKGVARLNPAERRAVRELYLWRDAEAERRDRPAFKVFGAAQLIALATCGAKSTAELARRHVLPRALVDRYGKALVGVLARAAAMPPLDYKPQRSSLDDLDRAVLDRLKKWRKAAADARPTDPSLVLNREVLERLATHEPRPRTIAALRSTNLLEDWRIDVYGEAIVDAIVATLDGV